MLGRFSKREKTLVQTKNTTPSSLSEIQQFERTLRAQTTAADLTYHMVNDFPRFLQAEQGFAYRALTSGAKRMLAAGSVADVNRDSAAIKALEDALRPTSMSAPEAVKLGSVPELAAMPFAMTLPFGQGTRGGLPEAVVLTRTTPWSKALAEQATYLADVYDHAFKSFANARKRRFQRVRRWFVSFLAVAAVAALALIPMPITVIAPARAASVVSVPAAPSLEGIVDRLFVEPGQLVRKGQPLYVLRDRAAQATKEEASARVLVAQARETQLRAEALRNPAARQELKVAEAETALAQIEMQRSEDILARHSINAPIDGMVVGESLSSLEGAPLSFGDAPMHIVDPDQVHLLVDVNIADTSVVYNLKQARVYFNDAPTDPKPLTLSALPFEPKMDARGGVSYQMVFDLDAESAGTALGAEGVVQLSGPEKPMGYVLFRRPLQWIFARVPW